MNLLNEKRSLAADIITNHNVCMYFIVLISMYIFKGLFEHNEFTK